MPKSTDAWRVKNPPDEKVVPPRLPAVRIALEDHLESWIEAAPEMLLPGLLVIGRQVDTVAGEIDLLAIDSNGVLVVIELKRADTYRETVAQVLDYAAAVARLSREQVKEIAEAYFNDRRSNNHAAPPDWDTALTDHVGEPSEWVPGQVRLVVAGAGTDPGVERIIDFLSGRFGVPINAHAFDVFQAGDASGDLIMVRRAVLSEAEEGVRTRAQGSDAALMEVAQTSRTAEWCSRILKAWGDKGRTRRAASTYWSIRRPSPRAKNVLARVYPAWEGYPGHLYIQPTLETWSEDSGRSEADIKQMLEAACGPLDDGWPDLDSEAKVDAFIKVAEALATPVAHPPVVPPPPGGNGAGAGTIT